MAVTVTQWTGAAGLAYNTMPSVPAGLSLPVTIANTAGDWLFALVAWRQPVAGDGVTVSVDDDAKNWWEPLGAPTGDSSPLGITRTAIWAAPAARVGDAVRGFTTVMIAPTGPVIAVAAIILDVGGLAPWLELVFPVASGYANAATSLSLTAPAPVPAQSFALSIAAADLSTAVMSWSSTGWTALTAATTTNGTDHTSDLELNAQWRVSNLGATPAGTWNSTAATDLSGALAAVLVTAAAPAAGNQNWPIVITEVAPGGGVKTPAAQIAWQDASHRDLSFTATQGQPYLLGGLQAGQGALVLDNPDINVTPPGAGPWAGIDSGCPVRVRAILPSSATPHYVAFSGFLQQLPTGFDAELLRGQIQATLADVFAYATSSLPPCLEAEILTDEPYAYWPLSDPAGSPAASNAAPANPHPLMLTPSKFSVAGVTVAFGSNSGALKGDSGSGMFGQSTVPSSGVNGYSLAAYDSGYPALAGGVTLEGWFQFTATPPNSGDVLTLQNSVINVLECKVVSGGNLNINTPGNSPIVLTTLNFSASTTPLWHLAVAFTRTAYTVYVNGQIIVSGTWATALPPAFSAVWVNGNASPYGRAFGQIYNGYSAHVALTPGLLPAARVQAHYQAGLAAFAGEYAHYRIERLLAYAGLQGRRVIIPEAPGMPGGFAVAAATPPQDTTPMSSLATVGGTSPSLIGPGVPGFTPGSGTQANSALVSAALSTVPALFTVWPTGAHAYVPRGYSANQPIKWVLGDNAAAGEIPVWLPSGPMFPYDPGTVRNSVALTQPDTGIVTAPSIASVVAQSQAQYGGQSYSATGYLQYDGTAGQIQAPTMSDLANWIAAVNATPKLRAGPLTVKASHLLGAVAPLGWPFVLGAASGDMVVVNARPPTSPGAVISVTARILQVQRTLVISEDGTEGSAVVTLDAAPEENVLQADDVARGLLSGQNVLAW